jgi:hypothetical protein
MKCPYAPGQPYYDSLRREFGLRGQRGERGEVLLRFHREAENQIAILQSFENAGWPDRIENAMGPHMLWDAQHGVSDAVGELNEHQERVHFWVERGTQAVHWEPIDEDPAHEPGPANPHSGC